MIVKDLDTLGYHRVVFRSDNEPCIPSLLRAVKLAWTGDAVQETSAEGDPQSNGGEPWVRFPRGHPQRPRPSGPRKRQNVSRLF